MRRGEGGMAVSRQVDLLEPINLAEHLDKVELYLGQVCQIAGILPEASVGRVVLGIGVNVNQAADELPEETPKPPTSLRVETDKEWPRAPLLAAILLELERSYDGWQQLHTNR